MHLSRKWRLACLLGLLVFAVGCDQTSKHFARTGLSREVSRTFSGGVVELRLAENPGSFLSLGAWLPDSARFALFTLGMGVGMGALAVYLVGRARLDTAQFLCLSLVLAGGLGNLLDRVLRHGLVTDFAIIHIGPLHTGVFNIADMLIMVGVGGLIWASRKQPPSASPTTPPPSTGG